MNLDIGIPLQRSQWIIFLWKSGKGVGRLNLIMAISVLIRGQPALQHPTLNRIKTAQLVSTGAHPFLVGLW